MSEELHEGESDRVARKRFAFQRANKDVLKDADQLAAYAAVYANIAVLGCVYPPEVMRRIAELSAGVEKTADEAELRSLVSASRARQHAAKTRQNEETGYRETVCSHILSQMKEHLLMTHREASGIEMLEAATKRLGIPWNMSDQEGETRVYVARILVLAHRFQHTTNVKEVAVNAVVDAFLEGGPVNVDGGIAMFKNRRPQFTFIDSVMRNLMKTKKSAKLKVGFVPRSAMESVLDDVNLPFTVSTKHLQGWEQQVEIRSSEVLLAVDTLKKGDCVKAKMDLAIDKMCNELGRRLCYEPFRIESTATGLKLV